jgi:hypothetical protein
MADQITITVPANTTTIATLIAQWKQIPLDTPCAPQCGHFLSPAEMTAYLLACMTDEDTVAGQLLACVLLSGIPPLDLLGAEWDLYDGITGKIELVCPEAGIYKTFTLSRPAMDFLHKLRGHFPHFNHVFHRDAGPVLLDEIIDAFERIAARAEMPLLSIEDVVRSYQYIAFNAALFGTDTA